jgi:hypothetical protein
MVKTGLEAESLAVLLKLSPKKGRATDVGGL